jgi:hypothetical protein
MSARSMRCNVAVLTGTVAGLVLAAPICTPAASAACSKPTFSDPNMVIDCRSPGIKERFVVPAGVRRLRVIAIGAGGGGGSDAVICDIFDRTQPCTHYASGGPGGVGTLVSADLRVKPGRILYVAAGGRGGTQTGPAAGAGGAKGGASGGELRQGLAFTNYLSGGGGGGGGASDVRTCSGLHRSCDTLASRLIVAGGGGGGGGAISANSYGGAGGVAGGLAGETSDGSAPDGGAGGGGGRGATATGGGLSGGPGALPGVLGFGGPGVGVAERGDAGGGGGGGGGLFGGGGASAGNDRNTAGAGGGGGSSFGPPGALFARAARLEAGSVRIVYLVTRVQQRRARGRLGHRRALRGEGAHH